MEGEDLEILKFSKNIHNGFYVDVGCYHPIHLNNCHLLFKKGWEGINIDISNFSIDLFKYLRRNDVNLNCAISNSSEIISYYYQKKLSQLTTLKENLAKERMQGHVKKALIKSEKLTTILEKSRFKNERIDFLNIDVEGADFDVLNSLDFNIYRPKIICIEIIEKVTDSKIYSFLKEKNYSLRWSSVSKLSHIFLDEKIY